VKTVVKAFVKVVDMKESVVRAGDESFSHLDTKNSTTNAAALSNGTLFILNFNFFLSLSLAVSSVELGKKGNGSPMSDSSIPDESAAFSNGTVYLLMFFVFKIKNAVDLK